jgi:hypothetical protein
MKSAAGAPARALASAAGKAAGGTTAAKRKRAKPSRARTKSVAATT